MHITKLILLWILMFSVAFTLNTEAVEPDISETTSHGIVSALSSKRHFTNGKPYSGFFCGRLCGVLSDRMENGKILPKIFKKEEKKKENKDDFLILTKRSIGSQQRLESSKRGQYEQRRFDKQRNFVTQRYPQNGGHSSFGGFSPGGQNRGFYQNGPYPQNRFAPSGQSLQNKRFSQGGKPQNGQNGMNKGFSQGGKSLQGTGHSQGGKSPQTSRFTQGGNSFRNTGYSPRKIPNKNFGLPQKGMFPDYRSDHQTTFVPSANIIPHDMLILSEHNPTGVVEEGLLVEGDIIIPRNSDDTISLNAPILWEKAQVHYEMDNSVDSSLRALIRQAMNEWEESSCIQFVVGCRTRQQCVRITTQTNLCSSLVGSAPGGQDLKLAANCHTLKIVKHELGHVIGFYHEQSRFDRDKYIHINKENLMPNTDTEFNKYMDSYGVEYDYSSIMQYDAKSFSNDRVNKNTMVTTNPHYQTLMGNSKGLSFRDKYRVNKMYSCSANCPNKNVECLNGGFLSAFKGNSQSCQCICPPRITGEKCEFKPHNYEYYDVPKCSVNVTHPTILQTPGYPHRSNPPEKCSYWIQAPKGHKVLVSFQDFSFADRGDGLEGPNKCYYEKVEIRNRNIFSGEMFCAEDLKGRRFTSVSEDFIMIIDTEDDTRSVRGLKAIVTFI